MAKTKTIISRKRKSQERGGGIATYREGERGIENWKERILQTERLIEKSTRETEVQVSNVRGGLSVSDLRVGIRWDFDAWVNY